MVNSFTRQTRTGLDTVDPYLDELYRRQADAVLAYLRQQGYTPKPYQQQGYQQQGYQQQPYQQQPRYRQQLPVNRNLVASLKREAQTMQRGLPTRERPRPAPVKPFAEERLEPKNAGLQAAETIFNAVKSRFIPKSHAQLLEEFKQARQAEIDAQKQAEIASKERVILDNREVKEGRKKIESLFNEEAYVDPGDSKQFGNYTLTIDGKHGEFYTIYKTEDSQLKVAYRGVMTGDGLETEIPIKADDFNKIKHHIQFKNRSLEISAKAEAEAKLRQNQAAATMPPNPNLSPEGIAVLTNLRDRDKGTILGERYDDNVDVSIKIERSPEKSNSLKDVVISLQSLDDSGSLKPEPMLTIKEDGQVINEAELTNKNISELLNGLLNANGAKMDRYSNEFPYGKIVEIQSYYEGQTEPHKAHFEGHEGTRPAMNYSRDALIEEGDDKTQIIYSSSRANKKQAKSWNQILE